MFLALTYPLACLYGVLWRRHLRRAQPPSPLGVPVIVVGNHVVGGAGKTPTVMALVQALERQGRHPGVISRGHGRRGHAVQAVSAASTPDEVGDEPLLMQRRTGVPVWVGRQRTDVARALIQAHPQVDVIVSDDGLQHTALARNAELVVFDERGVGNGRLLPAGPLREPLPAALPTARRVLYTAGAASTGLPGVLAARQLGQAWPLAAWQAGDACQAVALHDLRGEALLAVAGLAAPQKFFSMLRAAGLEFQALPLPDHYAYSHTPWPDGTRAVLTTEKDAVKLDPARLGKTRVWVVPLDLALPAGLVEDLLALLPPSGTLPLPHLAPVAASTTPS